MCIRDSLYIIRLSINGGAMNLNIRARREAAGMTQQELAKAAGKSFRTIQSWERDLSFPNAEMVWKLCEIFKVDPNELLGWYDEHPRQEAPASLPPEESELMRNYRACTPQWRSTAVSYTHLDVYKRQVLVWLGLVWLSVFAPFSETPGFPVSETPGSSVSETPGS